MLAEHRIDDADEGLVAVEHAVPTRQQVSLQPPFALVLAEHRIENAAGGRQELVVLCIPRVPLAVRNLEDRAKKVRECLVGTEDAEVPLFLVQLRYVAKEFAQDERILSVHGTRRRHVHCVRVKVRHPQLAEQDTAVGVWIRAHPARARRREGCQFRHEAPVSVEELLGPVALHPALELADVLGVLPVHEKRHLVRSECPLYRKAIDDLRPRPPFRRPEDDHGPARPGGTLVARALLWMFRISSMTFSRVTAIRWCIASGS